MGAPANREVLAFLANDVVELKEHTRVIIQLYEAIRGFKEPMDIKHKSLLVEEYERHQEANEGNLRELKEVVRKSG